MSYRSFNLQNLAVSLLVVWPAFEPPTLTAQQREGQIQAGTIQVLSVPAPLGGSNEQLLPAGESEFRNVIRGGLTVGALYDDNAVDVSGRAYGGYQYSLLPNLNLQQTRPHTAWSLDYRGGLTIDHKTLGGSPSIQNATAATVNMQHTFGRRLLLALREDYLLTNNPFGYTGQDQSTLTGTGQLNSFVAAPAATRIANVASGNLTYQFRRHSSLGFSGSWSTQRFREAALAPGIVLSLFDTRTTTGRGFYVLEITRRQKIGAEYQLQDLRFQSSAARTVSQTLFLFDEFSLKTNMTLTVFAGPDSTHTHNNVLVLGPTASAVVLPLINNAWSPAGGATFIWRGKHIAFSFSGQRVVTDGSGSTGAVRATSASTELRKDFTNRLGIALGYLYSDDRLLEGSAKATNSRFSVEQGSLIVERRLAEHLSIRTQYTRIQQIGAGSPAPLTTGNHSRAGVEMVYQFTRPLGR